jgi:hypothetical protein
MAYYALEPWGPERTDLNHAITAAMIANVNRDPRRGGKPVSPMDLMPKYGEATEMPSPEKMKERLLAAFGGQIRRKTRA